METSTQTQKEWTVIAKHLAKEIKKSIYGVSTGIHGIEDRVDVDIYRNRDGLLIAYVALMIQRSLIAVVPMMSAKFSSKEINISEPDVFDMVVDHAKKIVSDCPGGRYIRS